MELRPAVRNAVSSFDAGDAKHPRVGHIPSLPLAIDCVQSFCLIGPQGAFPQKVMEDPTLDQSNHPMAVHDVHHISVAKKSGEKRALDQRVQGLSRPRQVGFQGHPFKGSTSGFLYVGFEKIGVLM